MKRIFIILAIILSSVTLHAQFTTALLQASGLTCAMCTKAINKSLERLSFVESVTPDIKNSAFEIKLKQGTPLIIDQLEKAVEDAGFSVANLKLSGNFTNVAIKNDEHVRINGSIFHFLKVNDQVLNGEKQITIVDKDFVTAKEFRKYSSATQMHCLQTGKAAGCCKKDGIMENTRIFHATIS